MRMRCPRTPSRMVPDQSAQVGLLETSALLLLILVPLGFFALLFWYLRRVAPGGSVPESQLEGGAEPRVAPPEPESEGGRMRTQPCPRCSVTVRPHSRGTDVAECPNCGAPLFVQTTR